MDPQHKLGALNSHRHRVANEVLNGLRDSIANGTYSNGDRLPTERQLAEIFGVSQPTVREALRALDAMGLIEVRHGAGAFVANNLHSFVMSAFDTFVQVESVGLLDILEVRQALGRLSAHLAVDMATEEDVEHIQRCAEACADATAPYETASAIRAFQDSLARASHNMFLYAVERYLIGLLMSLQVVAKSNDPDEYWSQRRSDFQRDRLAIPRLLATRDEEATVNALLAYLADQREIFASDPELQSTRLTPTVFHVLSGFHDQF